MVKTHPVYFHFKYLLFFSSSPYSDLALIFLKKNSMGNLNQILILIKNSAQNCLEKIKIKKFKRRT